MTHIRTSRAPVPPWAGADNRFGWAGLLAGICGLTLFWLPYFFPAAGLAAIALGAFGYSKAQSGAATNRRTAVLGTCSASSPLCCRSWQFWDSASMSLFTACS